MRSLPAFLLLAATWSASSWAQSGVPSLGGDPLQATCSGLLEQSGARATGREKLCACLVSEVTSKLTVEEMTAYAQANLSSQAPPTAVMNKVTAIATTCLRQSE